jgi:2Fe-2S ferredoxin
MPSITYIEFDGTAHVIDVELGTSVMRGAVMNSVPGIDAHCGGACACATCHVYVNPAWLSRTGGPNSSEREMLDLVEHVQPNSRLSCQICVSEELDGLIVQLPEHQS